MILAAELTFFFESKSQDFASFYKTAWHLCHSFDLAASTRWCSSESSGFLNRLSHVQFVTWNLSVRRCLPHNL